MTGAGWHIRPGNPGDRELLAPFACADPAVRWQLTDSVAVVQQATIGSSQGWLQFCVVNLRSHTPCL
jgi:hypothetical protein